VVAGAEPPCAWTVVSLAPTRDTVQATSDSGLETKNVAVSPGA
jgi:hypothetical protein